MQRGFGSPLWFVLAGWSWLLLTALIGLATFLGIVRSSPLPPGLRMVHVHGALIGGLIQIMTGLALATNELASQETKRTHPGLFLGINIAALGLAAGSWLRDSNMMVGGGLCLIASFIPMTREMMKALRTCPGWTALAGLFFGSSLLGLFSTVVLGGILAIAASPTWHGMLRLGHVHSGLLFFLTLAGVGAIQLAQPVVVRRPAGSGGLTQAVFLLLPAGAAGLLTGFILSSVPIQLAAGSCLVVTLALYEWNLLRVWRQAGQPGSAAIDHLMAGSFLLFIMVLIGIAVGINVLWRPPVMPYGMLHVIAYTHMALIGFLLQAIVGGLSWTLPALLAAHRVLSQKKRPAYRDLLERTMDRWRALQVGTLSFGTIGLVIVAALTWTFPLSSPWIHWAVWVSLSFLLCGLIVFSMKIAQVMGMHPADERGTTR